MIQTFLRHGVHLLSASVLILLVGCGDSPVDATERVTLAHHDAIHEGMTHAEVVKIIGKDGVQIHASTARKPGADADTVTTIFTWQNTDGSNLTTIFENDRLTQRSQIGLAP